MNCLFQCTFQLCLPVNRNNFKKNKQVNQEGLKAGLKRMGGSVWLVLFQYLPGFWCSPNLFAFEKVVTEESWRRGSSQDEERTESQRITRRKWGSGRRSRPRPLSDYGQLANRSLSIPEDSIAVDPQKEDTVEGDHQPNTASADPADQDPAVGCPKGSWRRRPISVIGGVSFYGNSPTEEIESLLTQVRPGLLPPQLTEPSSFLAFVLSCELNSTLLFFLLSASRTTDSQPFFLTL